MHRCQLDGAQAVEADTRHIFPRHTHEQFGIGVICRGAQKSLSGRGQVEAGPGDIITVNPGEVHDGAPIGQNGRWWRMLYFDPVVIAGVVEDMSPGKAASFEFSLPVVRDTRVSEHFQTLFALVIADEATQTSILRDESVFMLLADMVNEQEDFGRHCAVNGSIFKARQLIDDDPSAAISLSDLAREVGMSRFQVLRHFVKATGLTPHAYLVQRRINVARHLIAQGTGLAEAADASGFADQSHMTRIFVRKYGVSPGAYADAVV